MPGLLRAASFLLPLSLAACGGAAAQKGPPPEPGSFAAMSKEQKLQHMRMVVLPTMSKVFQGLDAGKYERFGCATCHGPSKDQDPHQALVKLHLTGEGMAQLRAEKPEVMKFMAEKVTPAMAVAMGQKPYDPATRRGFGCGGCHTVD